MNKINQIHKLAKSLTLGNLAVREFPFLADPVSNEDFLINCLQEEINYREEKARIRRVVQAQLPTYKGFDEFDTKFQTGITDWQLNQLAGLTWIDNIYNLILIGPPGTGKTHIALSIGNKAVNERLQSVFFYNG